MNSLKSILTCAAVAAVALNSIADTPTAPYDKLDLTKEAEFKDEPTTPYVVSGDLKGDAVKTLAPTSVDKKDVEKFDVTFKPTFCDDASALPTPTDAKVGFAFVNETTAAYYNGSTWTAKSGVTASEGTAYAVHFDIDRRATPMARIKLDGTTLVDWFAVSDLAANAIAIYGTGTIVSMAGTTYTISAEVIEIIPEGETAKADIKFTSTQLDDLAEKLGVDKSAIQTKLNETAANGKTKLANYILFGKTDVEANEAPVAKGVPGEATEGKVKVALQGLNVQTVTGATVTYKLMGSTNGTSWAQVGKDSSSATFEFPATTTDRFFKVVTVITYATAQ